MAKSTENTSYVKSRDQHPLSFDNEQLTPSRHDELFGKKKSEDNSTKRKAGGAVAGGKNAPRMDRKR